MDISDGPFAQINVVTGALASRWRRLQSNDLRLKQRQLLDLSVDDVGRHQQRHQKVECAVLLLGFLNMLWAHRLVIDVV